MGIAADDIFVFCDAWKQSEKYTAIAKSHKRRMAYAFRRAQKSIFVTSTTTCVAFLSNAFSEQVPIRAFGIFASIIVPVNYIMVIFMMPSAVIIHERHIKSCVARCFNPCACKKQDDKVTYLGKEKIEDLVDTQSSSSLMCRMFRC